MPPSNQPTTTIPSSTSASIPPTATVLPPSNQPAKVQGGANLSSPIVNQRKKMKVPVFGKPAPCKPIPFPQATLDGEVSWAWCPGFSWLRLAFFAILGLGVIFPFLFLVGLTIRRISWILWGFFGSIIICSVLVVQFTWIWNASKQGAYKAARFKSLEADELWKKVDPQFHYYAKDTYYQTYYGGKELRVLSDGSIEMHGQHNLFNGGGDNALEGAAEGIAGQATQRLGSQTFADDHVV